MKSTTKKLVLQSILYNISALIFQSFITFYIIKYFDGIKGVLLGNTVLAISLVVGYLVVSRANHKRSISVRTWLFFACVICILSTCMMQWKTSWLLLLGFAFQGFGKGIYFCCLYLYEFAFIGPEERVKYAGAQYAWKSLAEIIIPLVLGYAFTLFTLPYTVYLLIFLAAALIMLINALVIYQLPEFVLQPLRHSHFKRVLQKATPVKLWYLALIGINIAVPLIGTLLEVQILQKESWSGIFQGVTKGVTLLVLLLILRYFHPKDALRQMMFTSILLGIALLLTPWRAGGVTLIVFSIARSFLFPLFNTYEKPIGMEIMEGMSSESHSMLPVIIVQVVLYALIRVVLFGGIYLSLSLFKASDISYVLSIVTGLSFIVIGILAYMINRQSSMHH